MADDPKTYTEEQVAERIAAETAGLKQNRDELLKESKSAAAKLKAYDGVDPEEYKKLKEAAQEAERKRLQGEGDFKALEAQLIKKYDGELEKERGNTTKYRTALEQSLIDRDAIAELAKHSDAPMLLLPHVKGQMKVMEHDGQLVARIVDSQGNVRIGKGQGSAPMTLPELMDEMKQDKQFAVAFRGSGSSGGGAPKSGASGGGSRHIESTNTPDFLRNLDSIAKGETTVGG